MILKLLFKNLHNVALKQNSQLTWWIALDYTGVTYKVATESQVPPAIM